MKTYILALLACCNTMIAFSQGSAGLIAHWDMNGGGSDVSGNGHTGHLNNVTPAIGMSGKPNSAYYFNGVNSVITAAYAPDYNTPKLSICATIKVMGFYSGLCQDNMIIIRENMYSMTNDFVLDFTDNYFPASSSCSVLDTTAEVLRMGYGNNEASSMYDLEYSPTIKENEWYRIVSTFDGVTFKIYVNDSLVNSYTSMGYPFVPNTDSIAIGYDIFGDFMTYPFQFKGLIDDIRLYNRVLTDSEVHLYYPSDTSCGYVTAQPVSVVTSIGHNATFNVGTTISSPAYQWQQDAGLGFMDLTNAGVYSGVNTNSLLITGVTGILNGDHYRCVISNEVSCADTSAYAVLTTGTLKANSITGDMIFVYPNPAQDKITVQLPYSTGQGANQIQGNILITDELGQIVSSQEITGSNTTIDLSKSAAAVYVVKIRLGEQVFYKKLLKN